MTQNTQGADAGHPQDPLFRSVFEEGSFSRAAEREKLVQPALSIQIKQLETELSVKLVERSAQGIQPTAAGRHFELESWRHDAVRAKLRLADDAAVYPCYNLI